MNAVCLFKITERYISRDGWVAKAVAAQARRLELRFLESTGMPGGYVNPSVIPASESRDSWLVRIVIMTIYRFY